MTNKAPLLTDAQIRKLLFRITEGATVLLTYPATLEMLKQSGVGWWGRWAGVVLVEGAFLYFWEASRVAKDRVTRAYTLTNLVAMYGVLLWVGLMQRGLGGWPPLVAGGLLIAHEVAPFAIGWWRSWDKAKQTGSDLAGFKHRKANEKRKEDYKAELADTSFKEVYKEEFALTIAHELQALANGSTLKKKGETTCEVVAKDGKFQARCQQCTYVSNTKGEPKWFETHGQAVGSGNAHRCKR